LVGDTTSPTVKVDHPLIRLRHPTDAQILAST
jgi:hypothetical protein